MKRHQSDLPKPRQLDVNAIPIGSLIYINDKYDKRNKPTSFHAKREIYRVMEKSYSGITAISPANGDIRTAPLRYCEPITKKDFDLAYPKEFFHEISKLSKDLYTRYHHSEDSFMKKINNPLSDPHNSQETAEIDLEIEETMDKDSCSSDSEDDQEQQLKAFPPPTSRFRKRTVIKYSK